MVTFFLDSSVLIKPEIRFPSSTLCCTVPVYLLRLKTGYIMWNYIFFFCFQPVYNWVSLLCSNWLWNKHLRSVWAWRVCEPDTDFPKQTNKQTRSIVLFIGKENVEFISWVKLQFKILNVNCYLTWGIHDGPTKQHITKRFRKDSRKSHFYLYQCFFVLKWVMS